MIQAILQDKSLEWMEGIFKRTLLKAKLFYEERIKITEVRGIREVRKLKGRIRIKELKERMKITEVRRYKVQGKKVKRENNDNKDMDELCLWQSSFFCWN